jgi:hypothetical protein
MPPETLATYRNALLGVTANAFGGKPVANGDPLSTLSAPFEIVKAATELTLVEEFAT